MRTCFGIGCDQEHEARGFCKKHYGHWVAGWPFEFDRAALVSLEKRIRSRVIVSDSGCWEWQGKRGGGGYGVVKVGCVPGLKQGSQVVHRVMWQIANGYLKPSLLACHSCDNRPCCNPEHIFPGTAKDNYADMVAKGRNHDASAA